MSFDPARPDLPVVAHRSSSPYTQRAIDNVRAMLDELLAGLPVESVSIGAPTPQEGHIIATTVMGDDQASSVLDRHLVYHGVHNLVVLGSGAFPTSAPAQPTLTLSALASWWAIRREWSDSIRSLIERRIDFLDLDPASLEALSRDVMRDPGVPFPANFKVYSRVPAAFYGFLPARHERPVWRPLSCDSTCCRRTSSCRAPTNR